jgi:hypothetical protein
MEAEQLLRLQCLKIMSNIDITPTDINHFILNANCLLHFVKDGYLPLHKGRLIPA